MRTFKESSFKCRTPAGSLPATLTTQTVTLLHTHVENRKMADTAKHRNTNNSANNGRKSKSEIIRSALGMYLKQRNYSVSLIHWKRWSVQCQCCKIEVCQNDCCCAFFCCCRILKSFASLIWHYCKMTSNWNLVLC